MKTPSKKAKARPSKPELEKARADFERGVIERGEAAKRDAAGKLPPGSTHELVDGRPVRARFSMT